MTVLYPAALGSPGPSRPGLGLTIIVGAEGFATQTEFDDAVAELWDRLVLIPPLESLADIAGNCAVYSWFDAPNATPFGVRTAIDGTLETDPDQVLAVLGDLELAELSGSAPLPALSLPWPDQGANPYATSLLVVLTATPTGRGEWLGAQRLDVPYHVVVSTDADNEALVAVALGRMAGLAAESPSLADTPVFARRRGGPNALPQAYRDLHDSSGASDPWQPYQADPGFSPETFRIDGEQYVRPGPTLMALPRTGAVEPKLAATGFGDPGFRSFGQWSSAEPMSIKTQQLRYHQAAFPAARVPSSPTGNVVTTDPPDRWTYTVEITSTGPVFTNVGVETYMVHEDGSQMTYHQPVLERLEFRDLAVVVANSASAPIDLTKALDSVRVEQGSRPTATAPADAEYQEGVCWSAVVPVGTAAGSVLVEVTLACAFRRSAADFDPPGAIVAAPFFPQIGFRQLKGDDVTILGLSTEDYAADVTTFSGTVRLVGDVTTPKDMRTHMIDELPPGASPDAIPKAPRNYLSLYADMWNMAMNTVNPQISLIWSDVEPDLRPSATEPSLTTFVDLFKRLNENTGLTAWLLRLVQAQWISFFDYVQRIDPPPRSAPGTAADPATSKTFIAASAVVGEVAHVAGYPDYRGLRVLPTTLDWADIGGHLDRVVYKEDRQGAYDNMHLNGSMGTVGDISAADPLATPRFMAPGCGHSCFHAHWRWGNSTYFLSTVVPGNPYLNIASLGLSEGIADALLALYTAKNPDSEDAAANAAAALWSALTETYLPAPADRFKGWSSDGGKSLSQQVVGAPLIPPNQALEVAVGGHVAPGAAFVDGQLDEKVKTVELRTTVHCDDPAYDSTWLHCTNEFPIGVAVRYVPDSAPLYLFRFLTYSYYRDPAYLPQPALARLADDKVVPAGLLPYSASKVFNDAYDIIPFLNMPPTTGETPAPAGPKAALFNPYRLIPSSNAGTDPATEKASGHRAALELQ